MISAPNTVSVFIEVRKIREKNELLSHHITRETGALSTHMFGIGHSVLFIHGLLYCNYSYDKNSY